MWANTGVWAADVRWTTPAALNVASVRAQRGLRPGIVPGRAHRREADLGVAAGGIRVAQIDVETGGVAALREDRVDHRGSDRAGIAPPAQLWWRVDSRDRGSVARPTHDSGHRYRLAIDDPELEAARCGRLRKLLRRGQRILRDRLTQKRDHPISKQRCVVSANDARMSGRARIDRLLAQRQDLLRYRRAERQAELGGTLDEPACSVIRADDAWIVERQR